MFYIITVTVSAVQVCSGSSYVLVYDTKDRRCGVVWWSETRTSDVDIRPLARKSRFSVIRRRRYGACVRACTTTTAAAAQGLTESRRRLFWIMICGVPML